MVSALVSGCSGSGSNLAEDSFFVLEETFYSPPTVRMGTSEFNAGVTPSLETQMRCDIFGRKFTLRTEEPLGTFLPNQFQKWSNSVPLIGQKNNFLPNQRGRLAEYLCCLLTRSSFLHRST